MVNFFSSLLAWWIMAIVAINCNVGIAYMTASSCVGIFFFVIWGATKLTTDPRIKVGK